MIKTTACIAFLTAALSATALSNPQRQRTTVKGPLVVMRADTTGNNASPTTVNQDTITTDTGVIIRLSGYDKPVTASRETMHISNLSDSLTVNTIDLTIHYLDRQGRELHKRDITLHQPIEPSHTELVTFPSWDVQRSFYYILSVKPRRQATPYDIRCNVNFITVTKPQKDNIND